MSHCRFLRNLSLIINSQYFFIRVTGACICPTGKVSCSQLKPDKQQECGGVSCIIDPCSPNGQIKGDGTCACNDGYQFVQNDNYLAGGYCEKINEECNLLGDTCSDYRGGRCVTCSESTGAANIYVPYCYNCSYYKGFNNTSQPNCQGGASNCEPCDLWFVKPSSDYNYSCCTGRNHENKECRPCNDPGIEDDDSDGDKRDKQKQWDDNCRRYYNEDIADGASDDIPYRQYCNSYVIGSKDAYSDWSSDGRIGICEVSKKGDGAGKDRDMIRYD